MEEEQRNVAEGIVRVNSWRCQRGPVYGRDLHQAFTIAKRCVCVCDMRCWYVRDHTFVYICVHLLNKMRV